MRSAVSPAAVPSSTATLARRVRVLRIVLALALIVAVPLVVALAAHQGNAGTEDAYRQQARADATARHLGMTDVMQMAREGQSDDVIINQIRTTNSAYTLSAEDLRMLRENNVSDRVIMEMQNRRADAHPRMRYVHVPPPAPVYMIGPPPPPPVFVVGPPPPVVGVGVRIGR